MGSLSTPARSRPLFRQRFWGRNEVEPGKMLPVLRSRAMLLEPAVRIGKNGLTPAVIREIDALLDKRKLVKIKLLKSSMETAEKQQLITAAAKETGALLVQSAGMTFALYRENPRRPSPASRR